VTGFGEYARHYHQAGWAPLPLPNGKKTPPPDGTTGGVDYYPSYADVESWSETNPDSNIALRLPHDVVGIDIDAYKAAGMATYARLQEILGPLPPTWRSSSKTDGTSGIYLFRLPEGVESRFGDVGEGIETIRWNHRYAIVSPSLHPDGHTYAWWYGPETTKAPKVADLPLLPASWVAHLQSQAPTEKMRKTTTPSVAYDALTPAEKQRIDAFVASSIEGIRSDLRASASWTIGQTDSIGRGWEKLQADKAIRMAAIALADWNPLSVEQAWEHFRDAAPTGGQWGPNDVAAKWRSQLHRAEPAPFPAPPVDIIGAAMAAGGTPTVHGVTEPPQSVTPWRKYTWDDLGNAHRTVALYHDRLRWIPELKIWAIFLDGRWIDSATAGERAVIDMLEQTKILEAPLYSETLGMRPGKKEPTSERIEFLKWNTDQRYTARISAAASMIRYMGVLNACSFEFDAEPRLLNVKNGVLDLVSGALMAPQPGMLMRQQVPVNYDPAATCPQWVAFLERVIPSKDVRDYLQRIVGYSITGDVGEQVFFLHHGETNNGKTVFLKVIAAMLGDYAQAVPSNTLLAKRMEQHPTDIARMEGRRWLALDETTQGARLDEATIKRLSGGGTMVARGMGQDFREFQMVGKVHMTTNHLPHINHDPATMRRLRLISWPVRIPDEEIDRNLAARIIANELPGVLAWAVRGTQEWRTRGLEAPLEATMDTERFIEEEDEFGMWMTERVVESDVMTPVDNLYRSYKNWCEAGNITPKGILTFGRELTARGAKATRTNTARGYLLRVRDALTQDNFFGK